MTITTEIFAPINVGANPNDGTGDSLRDAFIKVRDNFSSITDVGFDAGNIYVDGSIEVNGNLTINNSYVPSAANSPGTAGQLAWTSTHLYICVAANTWKRADIAAW